MRAISALQTKTSNCCTLQIFFYPDLKRLRYKESGFGKDAAALKAGLSPAERTGWLEGHP